MTSSGCAICDNPSLDFLFVAKGYEIMACGRCGFAQVGSPPTDDELARLYEDLHVNHSRFRDARAAWRENKSRLDFVKEFVPPGCSLLDAGCATGDFLALAKEHYATYGFDISEGAIAQAKERLPDIAANLSATRLQDVGTEWPRFDAICLWDVIEHVRDPVDVCRTLMALLKPGGHLFLSTPDIGAATARLMRQHWAFMIPPLHLGYFSRRSLDHVFSRRVPAEVLACRTRGKWTSVAFLFYKLGQISRWLAPPWLMDRLQGSALGKANLYVPTNDIIYLAARKPAP